MRTLSLLAVAGLVLGCVGRPPRGPAGDTARARTARLDSATTARLCAEADTAARAAGGCTLRDQGIRPSDLGVRPAEPGRPQPSAPPPPPR
jgi:hypothetical protein